MATNLYSTDTSNTGIEILKSVGANALTNFYIITFSGWDLSSDEKILLAVNNKGFTPPSGSQSDYKKDFFTQDIKLPGGKVNMNKQFSITFDIDVNYKLYKALLKCQSQNFIPSLGITYTLSGENKNNGLIGQIEVRTLDRQYNSSYDVYPSDGNVLNALDDSEIQYIFKNCWLSQGITLNAQNYQSSQSRTATAQFNFIDYIDPQRISVINGTAGI